MTQRITAWHFVNEQRTLGYDAGDLTVEPGYVYSEPRGELILCIRGMHASIDPFDALTYAPGPWLCKVQCWGDVIHGGDKLVCRHREVVKMRDVSKMLRLFACWCVRETPLADGRKVWDLLTDERTRKAVEVAEDYALGRCSQATLAATRAAALDATSATAWSHARAAALDATWAAAWAAANAAALDATWAAAWAAAWSHARAATSAVQRKRFNEMVGQEFMKGR